LNNSQQTKKYCLFKLECIKAFSVKYGSSIHPGEYAVTTQAIDVERVRNLFSKKKKKWRTKKIKLTIVDARFYFTAV
jgi:hypothetical protein